MNSKIFWLGIAVVVIVAGAYYMLKATPSSQNTSPSPTPLTLPTGTAQPTPSNQPPAQPQQSSQSLKELISLGATKKCDFTDTNNSGTVYVASGKARGDFNATSNGQTYMGHMIIDNQTSYIWMDGQAQGVKMTFDAAAQANATAQGQGIDTNKKMNYHCSTWAGDSTKFTLPSGVQFMDMKAMMNINK